MTRKTMKAQIEELKKDITEKEAMIEDYLNTMKRIQADFENFKKRIERENNEFKAYAKQDLILKLLDIKDNFERALSTLDNQKIPEEYAEGLKMIHRQFAKALEEDGIREIECLGKEFDPYYHEVLMADNDSDGDIEIVCEEFQKGYILKDKVIRHSKVKVKKQKSREGEK
ncbi:MAG: nucleotide exchange factor GrpE [Candidatus Methanofastidiosia archaeon]